MYMLYLSSVTRLGKISPLSKISTVFGYFSSLFYIWQNIKLTLADFYAFGQISLLSMAKY